MSRSQSIGRLRQEFNSRKISRHQELVRAYGERRSEWMDGWAESNNEDAEEITKESRRNRVICVDHCSSNSSILIADGDLLVSQILTRLPVKSLMRFKSVSKA
ncbi:hypothetical protein LINPERHAP1_LOCUS34327 [Linum perenne]